MRKTYFFFPHFIYQQWMYVYMHVNMCVCP